MADETANILGGTTGVAAPPNAGSPDSWQPPSQLNLDQPSVPVDSPAISGGNQPVDIPAGDPMTATIPSETAPRNPDIERDYHESRWHNILQTVGRILGGGTSTHIKTDENGNVSVTHDPSTTGEMWRRVAAAAVGGAAQGLANSRGPGGAGNAAAAGIQYGMNIPKQEQNDVSAQATAEQKRMEANANNAKLHQDLYLGMMRNNGLKVAMDTQSAQLLNDYKDVMKSSPDAKDYGAIKGFDDLQRVASENADFLKQHTNLQLKAIPVPDGKGGTALHAIATDPGDDERLNADGASRHYADTDDSGKPILKSEPLGAGRMKNGALRLANQAEQSKYVDQLSKWATAQKNQRDQAEKVPGSYQQAYGMAANTNDPDEKKKYSALGDQLFSKATQLKDTTKINNILPSNPDSLGNWGKLLSDPKSGVTLANVPVKERGQVINSMATQGLKIAKPLTGTELNRSDLAGNATLNLEKAQSILARRPDMFAPGGWLKSKFRQALEGGDPDAKDYQTAITLANLPAVGVHGVKGRWALEDLGKLDSNLYTNPQAMQRVLADIHDSVQEFADSGGRKTDTPAPTEKPPAASQAKPAQVPWPKIPPSEGNVYVYIPGQPHVGQIPKTGVAAFKAKHKDGQVNQ